MPISRIETASLASGLVAPTATALTTASGSAPSYSARAWVNFNGTSTVAIRASGNVSSITDNGTGDYTVNFMTAMVDANYCATLATGYGNSSSIPEASRQFVAGSWTTSSIRMRVGYSYTVPATQDASEVNVAIFR